MSSTADTFAQEAEHHLGEILLAIRTGKSDLSYSALYRAQVAAVVSRVLQGEFDAVVFANALAGRTTALICAARRIDKLEVELSAIKQTLNLP